MSDPKPGSISWKTETIPQSDYFGDIYFSPEDGLTESQYVFLDGTDIPACWQKSSAARVFHIGETGFGTGLNFLNCWSSWQAYRADVTQDNQGSQKLHFISVEAYPLQKQDLARALAAFPSLSPLTEKLLAHYPDPCPQQCWHQLDLAEDVTLTLLIGPAAEMFQQLSGHIQAWFLDGFAPARNPDMWSDALFTEIARLSEPGTRLATFTAAGAVRRGLAAVGFDMTRRSGYGRKRHMSLGVFAPADAPALAASAKRSCLVPLPKNQAPLPKIAVIGAGIAGACCAAALAKHGVSVTLFEQDKQAAQKASGNPIGLIQPGLSATDDPIGQLHRQAILYAIHQYQRLNDNQPQADPVFQQTGLLRPLDSDAHQQRYQKLQKILPSLSEWADFLPAAEAQNRFGLPTPLDCLFLAQAGMVFPERLVRTLLNYPGIDCHFQADIDLSTLIQSGPTGQLAGFDGYILAAGSAISTLVADTHWPLQLRRGQISTHHTVPETTSLSCPLSFGGYITPAHQGQHVFGASFLPQDKDIILPPSDQEHQENAERIAPYFPQLAADFLALPPGTHQGRTAMRVSCNDHLPLMGQISVPHETPIWICSALGSHGFTTAPLLAETVACKILGLVSPLPLMIQDLLAPDRFRKRAEKRSGGNGLRKAD